MGQLLVGCRNLMPLFWRGWRPLLITITRGKTSNGNNSQGTANQATSLSVVFPRWVWHADTLVQEAMDLYNEHYSGRAQKSVKNFRIQRCFGVPRMMPYQAGGADNFPGRNAIAREEASYFHGRPLKYKPEELGYVVPDDEPWEVLAFPREVECPGTYPNASEWLFEAVASIQRRSTISDRAPAET